MPKPLKGSNSSGGVRDLKKGNSANMVMTIRQKDESGPNNPYRLPTLEQTNKYRLCPHLDPNVNFAGT